MKILYVTDLHGDKNKYRKSLEIAMKQEIRVIVNGGDMLPKLGERHTEQPLFIKGFLSNYFSTLQEHNITYLNMLGNDDLLSVDNLFEQTCGGFANVHNIAGKKIRIDEYEFIGMNQIGTITCIQPGQTEFGDSSMVYAEIDLKSGAYARRIVNI